MKEKINTYSTLTPEEWYQATGETIEPNTTLTYTNDYGGDWIIQIK